MVRIMAKKRFLRQTAHGVKRVKKKWRKPKGSQSKMRKQKGGRPAMPRVGRRKSSAWRGLHPSGAREFFVRNLNDLKRVNERTEAIRISAAVGRKTKEKIVKRAKEMKLKILNP
jgi:large subunit ribosomal protein L32e